MKPMSLDQAVRNAIEVEESAARFYRLLADTAADGKTSHFLESMARQEDGHAESIRRFAVATHLTQLPRIADDNAQWVECSPDWEFYDNINFDEAIELAIQNEQSAAIHYDALASSTDGDTRAFFEALAYQENEHYNVLQEISGRAE